MSVLSLLKKTKKSNVQSIQKQHFLAYRRLFHFIATHSPEEAKQVREAYVTVLQKYYFAMFSKYMDRLLKLEVSALVSRNAASLSREREKITMHLSSFLIRWLSVDCHGRQARLASQA